MFDEASSRTFDVDRITEALAGAVNVLPQMQWRPQPVPFGLGRPLWVTDSGFDIRNHIRRARLPEPGTKAQLCRTISEATSDPIPPGRPPWELWFIEGYEGSKVVAALIPADRPVVANAAAKVRGEGDGQLWGTSATNRTFALPTHLADPLERLREAQVQTKAVRASVDSRPVQREEWFDLAPPILLLPMLRLTRLMGRRVNGNVIVSNVMGPAEKRYIGPMGIENFISCGHLKYAAGLNITVQHQSEFAVVAGVGSPALVSKEMRSWQRSPCSTRRMLTSVNGGGVPKNASGLSSQPFCS